MFKVVNINIKDLRPNSGQVAGLPKNPRFIRDEKFKALKKAIEDAPEMLALRELLVYDNNGEYVVIAGNMRYRAMKELGMAAAICKVLPTATPVEKLREYTIKDNNQFGQTDWDLLANEWDNDELAEWGMDVWHPYSSNTATTTNTDSIEQHNTNAPVVRKEDFDKSTLPEELQELDITPEKLPNLTGDDETLMERVIVVFAKEKRQKMAEILGITSVDKVVYHIEELEKQREQ